nr:MAG: hypothetical protein M1826_001874 [Phylliscum demangeonii]
MSTSTSDSTMAVRQQTREKTSSVLRWVGDAVERVLPAQTRRAVWQNTNAFASERPLIATFLAIQLALSALPLFLFGAFALGTTVLATVVALGFIVFWVGAAMALLVPTLAVAFFASVFVWLWVVGGYVASRVLYRIFVQAEQYAPSTQEVRDFKNRVAQRSSNAADAVIDKTAQIKDKLQSKTGQVQHHAAQVAKDVKDTVTYPADGTTTDYVPPKHRKAADYNNVTTRALDPAAPANGYATTTKVTPVAPAVVGDFQPQERFIPGGPKF